MADVNIKQVEAGEVTTLNEDDGFEIDTGTTSPWIKWSSIKTLLATWIGTLSLTLSAPTIADFTNAQHDHGDADDGGVIVSASDTVAGKVELATAAETTTGTDATRAVTPSGLAGSVHAKKGRVEFLADISPTTVGAAMTTLVGVSSPAEQFPYREFPDAAATYRDYLCRLVGYNGGGLTFSFEVMRTSAAAAGVYVFQLAIRRINTGTEDLGAAHTYDFNTVSVTVPAGPPAAGIPMSATITFTDGADMDSLADGELFFLRLLRDPAHASDNAGDTARVLTSLTGRET